MNWSTGSKDSIAICEYLLLKNAIFDVAIAYLLRVYLIFLLQKTHMNDAELLYLVGLFADLGIRKVRLTGGEPLLRRGLSKLVKQIKESTDVEVHITTNGSLLHKQLPALLDAGLDGLNVSVDFADAEKFAQSTGRDSYHQVLSALELAAKSGIFIKLNSVVQQTMEVTDALQLIDLAETLSASLRFIEFMPLCGTGWNKDTVGRAPQLERDLVSRLKLNRPEQENIAHSYLVPGKSVRVGFIHSLSQPFCSNCDRLRLSCRGELLACLFSKAGTDLLSPLREKMDRKFLSQLIFERVQKKKKAHDQHSPVDFSALEQPQKIGALIHQIGG